MSNSLALLRTRGAAILMMAVLVFLLLQPQLVSAHQQKAAITTILFNERSGNIEVMHRFELHDAEHAVKRLFNGDADIHKSTQTQQQFMQYVLERFALATIQAPIDLHRVGYEIDGKHLWVYQEAAIPKTIKGLTVTHGALQDIWPSQVNTVNVEGKGDIQTLIFSSGERQQSVTID